jgi:hypothetical protein
VEESAGVVEPDWPISTDGPHAITNVRRWLARQLMDSKRSDEEVFGVVAYHPSISDRPAGGGDRGAEAERVAFIAGWHARVTGSGDVPGGLESALGYFMRGGTFGTDDDTGDDNIAETEPRGPPAAPASEVEGSGWSTMDSAPDLTFVIVRTKTGYVFKAKYEHNIASGPDEGSCDGWVVGDGDLHPPCWTDGVCWASNEDEEPSDPPVGWMPLPAAAPPSSAPGEGEGS